MKNLIVNIIINSAVIFFTIIMIILIIGAILLCISIGQEYGWHWGMVYLIVVASVLIGTTETILD